MSGYYYLLKDHPKNQDILPYKGNIGIVIFLFKCFRANARIRSRHEQNPQWNLQEMTLALLKQEGDGELGDKLQKALAVPKARDEERKVEALRKECLHDAGLGFLQFWPACFDHVSRGGYP